MQLFIQQVLNGLASGSQYALWAVGYGLVYQVLRLMHFAHGDTLLMGLYIAYILLVALDLPVFVVFAIVLLTIAVLAVVVERVVYRPLVRRNDSISAFIAALGAAWVLRGIVTLVFGPGTKVFPKIFPSNIVQVGGLYVDVSSFLMLGVALGVVGLFILFLRTNKHGQAIAAVAQNRSTASLMGIPTSVMVTAIYAFSGIIGMVGALLFIGNFTTLRTTTGFFMTLKAFVAAIVGGIGRIEGAVLGGLMLGVMESLIISYVSSLYSQAIVFALLGIMLIVRPYGFFGTKEIVKF